MTGWLAGFGSVERGNRARGVRPFLNPRRRWRARVVVRSRPRLAAKRCSRWRGPSRAGWPKRAPFLAKHLLRKRLAERLAVGAGKAGQTSSVLGRSEKETYFVERRVDWPAPDIFIPALLVLPTK